MLSIPVAYPSKIFSAIQSFCSRLSIGLLSYDSRSTPIRLDHRKKFGRVMNQIKYMFTKKDSQRCFASHVCSHGWENTIGLPYFRYLSPRPSWLCFSMDTVIKGRPVNLHTVCWIFLTHCIFQGFFRTSIGLALCMWFFCSLYLVWCLRVLTFRGNCLRLSLLSFQLADGTWS